MRKVGQSTRSRARQFRVCSLCLYCLYTGGGAEDKRFTEPLINCGPGTDLHVHEKKVALYAALNANETNQN